MKKIILSLLSLVIPFWALTQNVGIGNTNPAYKADISGRMRIRGGADLNNSAGLWLGGTGTESQVNKAFIGIASDTTAGFFGNPGAGWAFSMDIRNGNTGIGQGVPLDKAGFTANNKVGAVNAIFGSNVSGVSIESDFPGIGFNTYYNGGRKAIASGYGGYIGADPVSGGLQFYVTDNTYAEGAAVTLHTGIAILPNGNTGIGATDPAYKLDVGGRMRLRSSTGSSAGLWLNNSANDVSPAFIGMRNDSLLGLYGAGSNWSFRMNTNTGHIGLGDVNPNAPLQFANTSVNRKIVLYESANNDHQFYGLGINASTLRYQTAAAGDDHVFYAGAGANSSNELMRVKGNGFVGIGVADPVFRLDVKDRMRIRSGGDNNTSAGIYFNNNANNSLASFVGMLNDNTVGFWGSGAGWGLTMNTQNGALSVGGSAGNPGQILTSSGSTASATWASAGNIIKTGATESSAQPGIPKDFSLVEFAADRLTLSLPSASRVILYYKARYHSSIINLTDDHIRLRLEIHFGGSAVSHYLYSTLDRIAGDIGLDDADQTLGPDYLDLPAGTHNLSFWMQNRFPPLVPSPFYGGQLALQVAYTIIPQ